MPKLFAWMLNLFRSSLIILICLYLGKSLSWLIDGFLPGSILGMLLLTTLLSIGLIKFEWIELGAGLLLRWLSLFFVPISVALLEHLDILLANGLGILSIITASTLLVMAFAGRLWQWLEKTP